VITAAHEYCHYLKDRREGLVIDTPDFFIDAFVSLYHPREHFAQVFAYRFLMPPAKIEELFARDLRSRPLSFEHILYLKRYFGVSIQAMLQWLRYLEHILPDEFEQYQKKDGDKLEKEAFGSLVPAARPSRSRSDFSDRGKLLTLEACRKKRITPEKLALLLRSDQKKGPLLIRSIP
jgi:Zn-dependent peptidase ImmA (M78 family)